MSRLLPSLLLVSPLVLAAACGSAESPEAPAPAPPQAPAQTKSPKGDKAKTKPKTKAAPRDDGLGTPEDEPEDADAPVKRATPKGDGRPAVIFVIIDTLRADHTSLCGYDRPTTPMLERLRDNTGASYTCNAYSAATWTVPSHASYFTGLTVPEHESDSMGLTFGADIPMLSEIMAERGYTSALISANPTLSETSGLQRGYEYIDIGKGLTGMRGDQVKRHVKMMMNKVDPAKPLFLTLNIIDAHDPYPAIPADVDWVPKRPELPFDVFDRDRDSTYYRYIRGEMPEGRAKAYVQAVTDGYDYGISMADRALQESLMALKREGWLKNGFRLVITSDHGEFLGEHRLLRHGCFTYEPVVNVPFLYFDSARETQIALPEPFSAINAFWLVKDGKLPDTPMRPNAFSKRRTNDVKKGADMAALWRTGGDKLVWMKEHGLFRFDLKTDPGEETRLELPANDRDRAELQRMADAHTAHLDKQRATEVDPERLKELEALGYVE